MPVVVKSQEPSPRKQCVACSESSAQKSSPLSRGLPYPARSASHCRLLLIDDHTLFRTGLKLILADHPFVEEIFEAGTIMSAIERLAGTPIDLILLDIQLPGINGLDGAQLLKRAFPSARIMVLSGSIDTLDQQTLSSLGLSGQLPKSEDPDRLIEAVLCCLAGHGDTPKPAALEVRKGPIISDTPTLTTRQIDVLTHLCKGQSNKVIAGQLGLAENTVRVHVAAILDHLMVSSRTEAVIEAQRRGLLGL